MSLLRSLHAPLVLRLDKILSNIIGGVGDVLQNWIYSVTNLSIGCTVFGVRTVEEPSYQVILQQENKEIRRYDPNIVAKTNIKGEYKEAQNEGFKILAGYIFGKNKKNVDIAMTAPVTQLPISEKII